MFLKDESTEIADPLLAPIPSSSEIFGISLITVSSRSGKRDVSLMDFFLNEGRVNQLATDHQKELQRYILELNTAKVVVNNQLQVYNSFNNRLFQN